jgi:hypothetical protein
VTQLVLGTAAVLVAVLLVAAVVSENPSVYFQDTNPLMSFSLVILFGVVKQFGRF